ncbi:hypothetical protein ES703_30560 [subsurface metagenome]
MQRLPRYAYCLLIVFTLYLGIRESQAGISSPHTIAAHSRVDPEKQMSLRATEGSVAPKGDGTEQSHTTMWKTICYEIASGVFATLAMTNRKAALWLPYIISFLRSLPCRVASVVLRRKEHKKSPPLVGGDKGEGVNVAQALQPVHIM